MFERKGKYLQKKCERCGWDEEVDALEESHIRLPGFFREDIVYRIEREWDYHILSLCPNCHRVLDFGMQRAYGEGKEDGCNEFIAGFLGGLCYPREKTKDLIDRKGIH